MDEGPKDEFKDRGQCIRPGPVSVKSFPVSGNPLLSW